MSREPYNTRVGDISSTPRPMVSFFGWPLTQPKGVNPKPGDMIIFDDSPNYCSYLLRSTKNMQIQHYAWYEFYAVEQANGTIWVHYQSQMWLVPTTISSRPNYSEIVQAETLLMFNHKEQN